MGQFRRFLNEAALKEIHLEGRLFTWSNERVHPTLEKINRVLINAEWDSLFPCHDLYLLASLCLDHASGPKRDFYSGCSGLASLASVR
jgi:hypothetical protein